MDKKEEINWDQLRKDYNQLKLSINLKVQDLSNPIINLVNKKREEIGPEKLKNFIERIYKFQQYEPYLANLLDSLENNTNLSHVNETLSLACFVQLIFENEDNLNNLHLFDVIKTRGC